ncbi:hypothetical protein [Bacillus gaemokensis]|uniref:Uncharacterized protein n=1 Tax=Bacillus gaemokensis TaxID=574375 RepID=A0A073KBY3_9BACI|nr:hypothetical protein [Bacillus gaemokensis]KEK23927.1 hypothetical protein BAGA_05765 [Bacillus gaemokensis]KYG38049.1 hypothetical protein AZF08_20020 [Bacillus gaemokensis]
MITEHKINIELTEEVYETCSHAIQTKMCYNNVFNVMGYFMDKFRSGEWKVAYGYYTVIENIMARHAFIVVTETGDAIDPTAPTLSSGYEDRKYISFALLDVDEYLDLIGKEDREPALYMSLREKDKEAQEWGRGQNLFMCS